MIIIVVVVIVIIITTSSSSSDSSLEGRRPARVVTADPPLPHRYLTHCCLLPGM